MFSFTSMEDNNITETFCIILSTIIAATNGFDLRRTPTNDYEVVYRDETLGMYYAKYFEFIAGGESVLGETSTGITVDDYHNSITEMARREYNAMHQMRQKEYAKKGEAYTYPAFDELDAVNRFIEICMRVLIPTACNAVAESRVAYSFDMEKHKVNSKKFMTEFINKIRKDAASYDFRCSSISDMWRELNSDACNIPQVINALRKEVHSYCPDWYNKYKDTLQSTIVFMRHQSLTFSNYRKNYNIVGIITNSFRYVISQWYNAYGKNADTASVIMNDEDGDNLNLADTQENIYVEDKNSSYIDDIVSFERYMTAIDEGSYWFSINPKGDINIVNGQKERIYYLNLLMWLQNKRIIGKVNLLNRNDSKLREKLGNIGLSIGGGYTYQDYELMGRPEGSVTANNDLISRFRLMDDIISEIYASNLTGADCEAKAQELYENGWARKSSVGNTKSNGSYPIDLGCNKGSAYDIHTNKDTLRNLVRGVRALKALENEIISMGYNILMLPMHDRSSSGYPNRLVTNVPFRAYIAGDINDTDTIESDILVDTEMYNSQVISTESTVVSIMHAINKDKLTGSIIVDSLESDDGYVFGNETLEREYLKILNGKGYTLDKSKASGASEFKDIVESNVAYILADFTSRNACTASKMYDNVRMATNRKQLGNDFNNKAYNEYLASMYYSLFNFVEHISISSEYLRGTSQDAEYYQSNKQVDPSGVCFNTTNMRGNENISAKAVQAILGFEDAYIFDKKQLFSNTYMVIGFNSMNWFNKDAGEILNSIRSNSYYKDEDVANMLLLMQLCGCNKDLTINNVLLQLLGSKGSVNKFAFLKTIANVIAARVKPLVGQDIMISDTDPFYIHRMFCLAINLKVATDYIMAGLDGISMFFSPKAYHNSKVSNLGFGGAYKCSIIPNGDGNSDGKEKNINVDTIILGLRSLRDLKGTIVTGNKYVSDLTILERCENIFNNFMRSIDFDTYTFNKKDTNHCRSFVFLDMMDNISEVELSSIDERVFQYKVITNYVQNLLDGKAFPAIFCGSQKESVLGFLGIVEKLCKAMRNESNREYFVSETAPSALSEEQQRDIESKVQVVLNMEKEHGEVITNDYNTWIENLIASCEVYNIELPDRLLSTINFSISSYKVNSHNLITHDGRVMQTKTVKDDVAVITVLTRYGIFEYRNGIATRIKELRSVQWLMQ